MITPDRPKFAFSNIEKKKNINRTNKYYIKYNIYSLIFSAVVAGYSLQSWSSKLRQRCSPKPRSWSPAALQSCSPKFLVNVPENWCSSKQIFLKAVPESCPKLLVPQSCLRKLLFFEIIIPQNYSRSLLKLLTKDLKWFLEAVFLKLFRKAVALKWLFFFKPVF